MSGFTRVLVGKPVGLLGGAVAGLVAGAVVNRVWRWTTGNERLPDATDDEARWAELLVAAAFQGAVFAVVKAAIDRSTSRGVRRLTD